MNTWQSFWLAMIFLSTTPLILDIINRQNKKKAEMNGESYDDSRNPLMFTKIFLRLFTVIYIAFFMVVQMKNL